MAWATDLMRTSRPAWDISFSFHPLSLLHTLSLISEKLAYFALPKKDGNPRYFLYCFIARTPNIPRMFAWATWGVDLLKKNGGLQSIYLLARSLLILLENSLNVGFIMSSCFAKEEGVVSKEQMSDFGTPSTNGNTLKFTYIFCFLNEWVESFCTKKK